jgi:transcription initiation factor TFIIIB Brf1 subunit/transcription initiation factor TFIIB
MSSDEFDRREYAKAEEHCRILNAPERSQYQKQIENTIDEHAQNIPGQKQESERLHRRQLFDEPREKKLDRIEKKLDRLLDKLENVDEVRETKVVRTETDKDDDRGLFGRLFG